MLCLALVLSMAALATACPLVAVPTVSAVASVGAQSVAIVQPQVAVQSFAVQAVALAVQPVAVQTFALQAVALPLQAVAVCSQGGCAQRAQRVGILSRVLGSRSRSVARSVSVAR